MLSRTHLTRLLKSIHLAAPDGQPEWHAMTSEELAMVIGREFLEISLHATLLSRHGLILCVAPTSTHTGRCYCWG